VPEVGRFCAKCGADVRASDAKGQARRGAYAAHPREPVTSVNVVTSLMPLAAGRAPHTYRWALMLGLGVPIVAAAIGFLPFALAAAAIAMPLVYLVYLYDVNQWEDQPIPVVAAAIALAGALALGFTLLWRDSILGGGLAFRVDAKEGFSVDTKTLLVIGLLVPVVSEILKQLGPLWLLAQRRFDDLIDGLTFGIAAGAAFALVETIVLNNSVIFDGPGRVDSPNAAVWISIVVIAGLVKPIVYGSASGLACAAFSGVGEGPGRFSRKYALALAEAIAANIAFQVGVYLTGRIGGTLGVVLGLVWALIVAGVLLVRVRMVLHVALLEGALEAEARGETPSSANQAVGFCGECHLPLVHGASFCVACGAAVRAASKLTRAANADKAGSTKKPTTVAYQGGASPADATRRSGAVLVGVAVVLIAVVGAVFAVVNLSTSPDTTEPHKFEPEKQQSRGFFDSNNIQAERTVKLEGGVTVSVPKGWKIQKQDTNFVILSVDGANFRVITGAESSGDTAGSLLQTLLSDLIHDEVQDIDGSQSSLDPPTPAVSEAEGYEFTGTVVGNQGTVSVEGYAAALVTTGGRFVLCDSLNTAGDYDSFKAGFNQIFNSVLNTIRGESDLSGN
jgi:hypothetical protein